MLTAPELKEQSKLDSRFRGNDGGSAENDSIKGRNDIERLSWKDSLAIQELLNVISQIIADEYITIAKENPETFTTGG
jgi:hypothetical protein